MRFSYRVARELEVDRTRRRQSGLNREGANYAETQNFAIEA